MVSMIPVHFQNRGNIRTEKPFEISSYRMEEGGVVDFCFWLLFGNVCLDVVLYRMEEAGVVDFCFWLLFGNVCLDVVLSIQASKQLLLFYCIDFIFIGSHSLGGLF